MRKRFTPLFKAEVARELLREDKPMSGIAVERGVATTQLNEWKATDPFYVSSTITAQMNREG